MIKYVCFVCLGVVYRRLMSWKISFFRMVINTPDLHYSGVHYFGIVLRFLLFSSYRSCSSFEILSSLGDFLLVRFFSESVLDIYEMSLHLLLLLVLIVLFCLYFCQIGIINNLSSFCSEYVYLLLIY